MILTIHQPNYLPWLGYFNKLARSDIFVLLDNVSYSKNGFVNRNRIKTDRGAEWLTVSVLTRGISGQLIKNVRINNALQWNRDHERSIRQNYARAPYFECYFPSLQKIYHEVWEYLTDLNEAVIRYLCEALGIGTDRLKKASTLDVAGSGTELLLDICRAVGANTYLSGPSGRKYLDADRFKDAGIRLEYLDYEHPIYHQLRGEFIPNISVIDLLFNEGPRSLDILLGKARESDF